MANSGSSIINGINSGLANTYAYLASQYPNGLTLDNINEARGKASNANVLNQSFASYLENNFTTIDKDGDGIITEQEMSNLSNLISRQGLTKDELTQLYASGSSGLSESTMSKILEHFEIKDRFDIIGYSKDFKAALNLINTKFNSSYSEENGIVLSDSPADIQKAKNEGYKTVAIRGGMGNRELLVNSGADLCFSVASEIEKFINILSDPEQTSELKNFAMKNEVPIMQDEGSDFICTYIKENNVKNILEIGSAIGYSSMKFARLSPDIHVTTIEIDEERYRTAVKNFKENNLTDRITIFHGDALTYPIEGKFDLIFIDAAKAQYIKFFERFKENLSEQGVIFSDNLSFHGMVEDLSLTHNYSTIKLVKKIRKYIDFLKNNTEFKTEFFKR